MVNDKGSYRRADRKGRASRHDERSERTWMPSGRHPDGRIVHILGSSDATPQGDLTIAGLVQAPLVQAGVVPAPDGLVRRGHAISAGRRSTQLASYGVSLAYKITTATAAATTVGGSGRDRYRTQHCAARLSRPQAAHASRVPGLQPVWLRAALMIVASGVELGSVGGTRHVRQMPGRVRLHISHAGRHLSGIP
jgi:hypothetical protein